MYLFFLLLFLATASPAKTKKKLAPEQPIELKVRTPVSSKLINKENKCKEDDFNAIYDFLAENIIT